MAKSICFFVKSLYGGGAQRVISLLANNFINLGFDVLILTVQNEIDYPLNPHVKIHCLHTDFTTVAETRALLLRYKCEKLVVFSSSSTLYRHSLDLTESTEIQIVAAIRNDPYSFPLTASDRQVRDAILSEVAKKGGKFVFQTKYAMKYFCQQIQKNSTIINNPLAELPAPFCGARTKEIVSVGRFEQQKNFPMLLKAFSKLVKTYPQYTLSIYGKGSMESELKKLVKDLGVQNSVRFPGFIKDVHTRIRAATMFVLPSNYEGISNAMLESLALGIPTIVTDCPAYGGRIFIKHNHNGLLVPVEDTERLVVEMQKIIENPHFAMKLGKEGINIRKLLDRTAIIEKWAQFLAL